MTTKAQSRATARYQAKTYDKIDIRVPKGTRDRWKTAAEAAGESLAGFVSGAVESRIGSKKAGR